MKIDCNCDCGTILFLESLDDEECRIGTLASSLEQPTTIYIDKKKALSIALWLATWLAGKEVA